MFKPPAIQTPQSSVRTVPGLIISQHSGEGKANFLLRLRPDLREHLLQNVFGVGAVLKNPQREREEESRDLARSVIRR